MHKAHCVTRCQKFFVKTGMDELYKNTEKRDYIYIYIYIYIIKSTFFMCFPQFSPSLGVAGKIRTRQKRVRVCAL